MINIKLSSSSSFLDFRSLFRSFHKVRMNSSNYAELFSNIRAVKAVEIVIVVLKTGQETDRTVDLMVI